MENFLIETENESIICYPKTLEKYNFTIDQVKEFLNKKDFAFTDIYEVPSDQTQYYIADTFYNDFEEVK